LFCRALLKYGHVQLQQVLDLVPYMPLADDERTRLALRIRRWAKHLG
jgi:hypothetical protein